MQSLRADGTGGGPRLPGVDQPRYSRAMAFRLGRGGKRGSDAPLFNEDQVIWGVPRRAGLDEQDDPKAHAGLTQHAFEVGNDDRAICGFEPPKRASSPTAKPKAQLSMPNTRLNPRCPKCLKLIAVPVTELAAASADTPAEAVVADAPEVGVAGRGHGRGACRRRASRRRAGARSRRAGSSPHGWGRVRRR
jgi:hypothetical protein